jgi:predicted SAM-dependent methyltransferase
MKAAAVYGPWRVDACLLRRKRRDHLVMTREEKLLQFVDRNAVGLEIGPSYNPVAPKLAGWNVEVLDHLNAADLRNKYAAWGVGGSKIEEVDYVISDNSIFGAVNKEDHFDFIIASHVIEHMTDMLRFLTDCQRLLKPDGVLSLAVPDKRFCFDIFKPVSSTGMVLQAYHEKRTQHLPGLIFDQYANHVMCGDKIIWFDQKLDDMRLVHSVSDARVRMDDFIKSGIFVDIHAWFFTPSSFRLIIHDLNEMGSINMGEAAFHPTEGFEFFVTLKKGLKARGNDRLALLRSIDGELRGHS